MRKTIGVVVGIVLIFFIAGTTYAKPAKVIKWKLQCVYGANDLSYRLFPHFTKMVTEKSGGRFQITAYPANELVKVPDTLKACGRGMVNMVNSVGAYWKGMIPEAEIEFMLPMSWVDQLEVYSNFDYGLRDFFRDSYAKHGIYYLQEVPFGNWGLFSNKPIRKIEDFKGIKLRATGAQEGFLAELGASTIFLPVAEIYTALQLGTVDAAGMSPHAWTGMNYKDVAKYYIQNPPLGICTGHLLVNSKDWEALPDDLKNVLGWAAEHYIRIISSEYNNDQRMIEASMEPGRSIVLPPEEVAKMRKRAVKVWDDIAKKSPRCAEAVKMVKDYLSDKR